MNENEKARVNDVLNNVAQVQIDLEDLHLSMDTTKQNMSVMRNTIINLNKRIENMENGNGSIRPGG